MSGFWDLHTVHTVVTDPTMTGRDSILYLGKCVHLGLGDATCACDQRVKLAVPLVGFFIIKIIKKMI